ncbi:50S ribosomal protein L18 [Candidatus Bipolaricaulota bacterium]|nr:50S ribosomal protein L18 [Candidatus Bipolaricaulota bacterium]HBR10534.1 50S ribosomal protein L18 [Candidatus Acetothermia bacterium]
MAQIVREKERKRRHQRIRKRMQGTAQRPRLCVFRSLRHIYAQLIDDNAGTTLVSVSTLTKELQDDINGCNCNSAEKVGELLARRAAATEITTVIFDRGGYRYHGKIKALAEACRRGGLLF